MRWWRAPLRRAPRSPVEDQFYGDRSGQIEDPFGHVWFVATRKEYLSTAEIQRRYDKHMAK